MTRGALSLLSCSFGAAHLAFSTSCDISKGWSIIADKRIVGWRRIFGRLSASTDYRGIGTIMLLRVFVRMQGSDIRWEVK